ncbi:hypothetical protein [Actinomadura sp. 9N407]|uniref:hypothetical protein n=1 Tax=Actinomadura sp. 9N407 TaxID=3375154 RepID=UPI00379FD704
MDGEQLAATVYRLVRTDSGDLICDVPGHPDGHACLPVSGGVDVDGLVTTLTEQRYEGPFTETHGLPPLPLSEQVGWTHAWVWDERAVALGQGPDGRPVLAVTERNMPRPDELPAEMSWVERLVAITGGLPAPVPAPDWAAVESRLGTALPGDYKRLVETFGCDGAFDLFFEVFTPEALIWHADFYAGDDPAPGDEHPAFPAQDGVLAWSSNEHQETFFWITGGPDPDRWPIYGVDSLGEGSRFESTATEFLFRQMTDPRHPFYTTADLLNGHWFMKFVRTP